MVKALSGGGGLKDILGKIARASRPGPELRVGFLEGSTYPDGTSVPVVAAINEFGAPGAGIPPRPFFRGAVAEHADGWGDDIGPALKAADYDTTKALAVMGEVIKGDIQQSIRQFSDPPNALATIKAKGAAQPLVDSGHMLASVAYEVNGGGGK